VKKWYALVGVLATVMCISLGTCTIQMGQAEVCNNELSGTRADLTRALSELSTTLSELSTKSDEVDSLEGQLSELESQLASTQSELEEVRADLAQLKATKELEFGEGLSVFDVSLPEPGSFWGSVSGKVQNISDESMETVMILVASYDEDGSLEDVSLATVSDLYPEEIGEWECYPVGGATYDVYAFGNR